MSLDEIPSPPDLTNRGTPAELNLDETDLTTQDLRREELEEMLDDGAWWEGVEEWFRYSDLSEADVRRAEAIGLFRAFDFFWDPGTERLRYVTPAVPDRWDEEAGPDDLPASIVRNELDELGEMVAETIAADYMNWGDVEPSNLVWGVDWYEEADEKL